MTFRVHLNEATGCELWMLARSKDDEPLKSWDSPRDFWLVVQDHEGTCSAYAKYCNFKRSHVLRQVDVRLRAHLDCPHVSRYCHEEVDGMSRRRP